MGPRTAGFLIGALAASAGSIGLMRWDSQKRFDTTVRLLDSLQKDIDTAQAATSTFSQNKSLAAIRLY